MVAAVDLDRGALPGPWLLRLAQNLVLGPGAAARAVTSGTEARQRISEEGASVGGGAGLLLLPEPVMTCGSWVCVCVREE